MLVEVPDVFSLAQVEEARNILDAAEWVDGNVTSGAQAALAKRNAQIPEGAPAASQVGGMILDALERNAIFISAGLPYKIYPPLFNRYAGGQAFDSHIDNAIRPLRGTDFRIRTDLSATLFLTEPEDYDGGELLIEDTFGTHSVKLSAGSMVLYPSTSLHRVLPVTRGARTSSFFWIQSMVRGDAERAQLYEIDTVIQSLYKTGADKASIVRLTGVYHNLIRRWAEL